MTAIADCAGEVVRAYRFIAGRNTSSEELTKLWEGRYGELAVRAEGAVSYERTVPTQESPLVDRHRGPTYIAVESWAFPDAAAAFAWRASGVLEGLAPDLVDDSLSRWVVAQEHLIINGAPRSPEDGPAGLKLLIAMTRKDGVKIQDFQRWWVSDHIHFTLDSPGTSRYAISTTVADEYEAGTPTFDGVCELWWRTPEDRERALGSPAMAGLPEDMLAWVDPAAPYFSIFAVDAEHRVEISASEGGEKVD